MWRSNSKLESALMISGLMFLIASVILSLSVGATNTFDEQIFWLLRMPRTLTAIGVGGGLCVAGALIQAGLGNPLADPYTIGIASAAALGAILGSTLFYDSALLSSGVLAFAASLLCLLALSLWLKNRFRQSNEILLAGVVAGFFFTSLATLVRAISDPATWTSNMIWLMGSLGHLSLTESVVSLMLICGVGVFSWTQWKPLDLLTVDELSAESAGVDVSAFRKRIFIIVSIITAICVSVAGVIGFIGLIIPHILRRTGLRSHFILIPAAFIYGASALIFSDVIGRIVVRPSELPVGVVTAIFGAPFFLFLIKGDK